MTETAAVTSTRWCACGNPIREHAGCGRPRQFCHACRPSQRQAEVRYPAHPGTIRAYLDALDRHLHARGDDERLATRETMLYALDWMLLSAAVPAPTRPDRTHDLVDQLVAAAAGRRVF